MKKFLTISMAMVVGYAASASRDSLVMDSINGVLHVVERTVPPRPVRLGNENIKELYEACSRARVAVVANQTSIIGDGRNGNPVHLVDTLLALGIDVRKVFAPEHGFRGEAHNGANINDSVDPVTGIPILSLHGKHRKPTAESLQDVRMIIFDIQDVGARFYTYLSSLFLVMEAAAENGQVVVVLDRPNPHGHQIAGPVRSEKWKSFVGQVPVPVLHGMTLGEMAQLFNGEGWLEGGIPCDLIVIPCEGYAHSDAWYPRIAPSPNLPTAESIALYPSLCPFEPTVVSVGRGTPIPFECIGMPDGALGSFAFTPQPVPGAAPHPKHEGIVCFGQNLHGQGEAWMQAPSSFSWNAIPDYARMWQTAAPDEAFVAAPSSLARLSGDESLEKVIRGELEMSEFVEGWLEGLRAFDALRQPYLLYPVQRLAH
ncbi:MAG: exo-beta-N-acetylmuramidase NamZ family protein [Flavobacteriales bacterium]